MFERWNRASQDTPELDLIPVMNLFMVLIPFLLMGAAFFHIAVVPTSLPTHTPSASDVPKTPKTVTVNLVIDKKKIQLTTSSTSLDEAELAALAQEWKIKGDTLPLEQVRDHLRSIKESYPASNTMIVMPHDRAEYQGLLRLLDAAREYQSGKDAKGEPIMAELFPVVVFSRFLTAAQAPVPEGLEAEPTEAGQAQPFAPAGTP